MASETRNVAIPNSAEKRATRRAIRLLHDAISANDISDVKDRLSSDTDVNFHYKGQTALQIAVLNGYKDICKLLLECGADVNKTNAEGNSLLSMACWHDHARIAQMLIDYGAELDTVNNHGATPLNSSAYKGHVGIVKILVDANCDLDLQNSRGQSPLFTCARVGHCEIARLLVKAGCKLNSADNDRVTALIEAAQNGFSDIVEVLVEGGCDMNLQDRFGATAVYLAAIKGYPDIVQYLVGAGTDVNVISNKGSTPLLESVRTCQELAVPILLVAPGVDINRPDNEKNAPIHIAVRQASQYYGQGHVSADHVAMLVSAGCQLNVADKEGWRPLYQAAFGGNTDMVRLLLDEGAEIHFQTLAGDTALHAAIYGGKYDILDMLLKKGCDVNITNSRNELPLYTAVDVRSKPEMIRALLRAGSDMDVCENAKHQSPLFMAVKHGYREAVDILVDEGCDVNMADHEDTTPLNIACVRGHEDIVAMLLRHPNIELNRGSKRLPLHSAAVYGFYNIVDMLLQAGVHVDKYNDLGNTALQLATELNNLDVVKLLISWGANLNIHDNDRLPMKCCYSYRDEHPHMELEPLFNSVKFDNIGMTQLLLSAYYRVPHSTLRNLHAILFQSGYAQEANVPRRVLVTLAQVFMKVMKTPRTLKQECRAVIRESMGQAPVTKAAQLPLPERVKDYVLYKDIFKGLEKMQASEAQSWATGWGTQPPTE